MSREEEDEEEVGEEEAMESDPEEAVSRGSSELSGTSISTEEALNEDDPALNRLSEEWGDENPLDLVLRPRRASMEEVPDADNDRAYQINRERIRQEEENLRKEQEKVQAEPSPFVPAAMEEESDELWGPKLDALPEEPLEEEVAQLVNLGPDIPEEI
ncbi:hypothetical protein BDZ89DRAFT_1053607 [Hymenopellis radicata]|nr:hypothetical protein BDZ89DRAFT_1053607 [Hymenopellis radicata]